VTSAIELHTAELHTVGSPTGSAEGRSAGPATPRLAPDILGSASAASKHAYCCRASSVGRYDIGGRNMSKMTDRETARRAPKTRAADGSKGAAARQLAATRARLRLHAIREASAVGQLGKPPRTGPLA
jgi:hypothetical protein